MPLHIAITRVLLLCLAATASAVNLMVVFNFPPPLVQATETRFEPGENVKIRWTSTHPWISLELYQVSSDDGAWTMAPLLSQSQIHKKRRSTHAPHRSANYSCTANTSNATTFYIWTAHELPGMNREDPFHLRLFNVQDPNCRHCHSNSSDFVIIDPSAVGGHSFKLGVGLGLGLGVPVLVTLTVLATWLWVRKRKRRAQDNGSQSGEPLVDWKGLHPSVSPCSGSGNGKTGGTLEADPDLAKVEMEGRDVIELPVEAVRCEAPGQPTIEDRVELEGNPTQA